MKTKVLVTGKIHRDALTTLDSHPNISLIVKPDCSRQELHAEVADSSILITRSETAVDSELLNAAPELKVIVRAAVGVGNIDLNAATDKGILVINTPGKNTNSAAELTMGLMLAMMRKIPTAQQRVKVGGWDRHKFAGVELRNKKLGIVGLGNVGHRVAKFAHGFDMEVLAFDPYISPERFKQHRATPCKSLEELVSKVDILSMHVPLNSETRNMVGKNLIQKMKPGSYIVNAARGGVINETDLLESLASNHIEGAALDTFNNEPKPLPELIENDRVWCSPHIGASTEEAQKAIGDTVAEQVIKHLEGGVVDYPVNLPEIGIIEKPILKAYATLCEKIGSLMGQMIDFNPENVTLHYRGDIADLDNSILRLGWMKGFVGHKVADYISYVNVASHIKKMGLHVEEAPDPEFTGYKSAVKVVIDNGIDTLTVGGVVMDERYIRISLVNDFYFEVEPSGHLIFLENHDKPGVIGHVGSELADQGVNISSFSLSRNKKGGKAMSVVVIDSALGEHGCNRLKEIDNVTALHSVHL